MATDPGNLDKAESGRTIAVVSTSQIPTGQMVVDTAVHFPELAGTLINIDRVSRKDDNVYLDALALAEGLFADHMATNPLMIGAAFQAGALPISAASIEQAIRLNGVAVEMNLLAFRWGRLAVADPKRAQAAVHAATRREEAPRELSADARRRSVNAVGGSAELRRLLEIRVPELIAYQSGPTRASTPTSSRAWRGSRPSARPAAPGSPRPSRADLTSSWPTRTSTRWRACTSTPPSPPSCASRFGPAVRVYWNLHPPLLRALGLKKKLKLGTWFTPRVPRAPRDAPACAAPRSIPSAGPRSGAWSAPCPASTAR